MRVATNIKLCAVAAVFLSLVANCCVTIAESISVQFSNFTVGDTFPNASLPLTIVADGIDIELTKYNNSFGARGRIVNRLTTGTDNALLLSADLRAEIVLPDVSAGGFFFFRNQGGDNLLEINGETLDFTDSALAGSDFGMLGGVEIHSSGGLSNSWRSVKLDGLIRSLAFIGQELSIDEIELGLGLPGDKDLDHFVDAADYVAWRKTNSSQYYYSQWRTYFGEAASIRSSSSFAVPELNVLAGLLLACPLLGDRRRRRG